MLRLTRQQVREVDRIAIEQFHVPGIVLMENAALAVVEQTCLMLDGECVGEILILCGGGNNGGDGLAAARHLQNIGATVTVALTVDPDSYKGDALINWRIVRAMGIRVTQATPSRVSSSNALLVIDAIFGTGLKEAPRDPFAALADAVNHSRKPVLAVDIPSGLDCDTGAPPGACIRASSTVTFVAEKVGFARPSASQWLGNVVVAEIGCPRAAIDRAIAEAPAT